MVLLSQFLMVQTIAMMSLHLCAAYSCSLLAPGPNGKNPSDAVARYFRLVALTTH